METVNDNRGLLKKITQPCRENNELVKQVNVLKNEKEESLNGLEQMKKTMRMMTSSTMTLDQIMLTGITRKDHKGIGFTEEISPIISTFSISLAKINSIREECFSNIFKIHKPT